MKTKWCSKDVHWYSLRYKKPIAYSTVATSDYITMINKPNMTAIELLKVLKSDLYLHDTDAIMVIQEFVNRNLGNELILTKE